MKPGAAGRVQELEAPQVMVQEFKKPGECEEDAVQRKGEELFVVYSHALQEHVSFSVLNIHNSPVWMLTL